MNEQQSKWHTQEVVQIFLKGVRGAIPAANLQLEVMMQIVSMWSPAPKRVLDLGCGDGLVGRMLLERFPTVKVMFADFSDPMLHEVNKGVGGNPRATIIKCDFSSSAWIKALGDQKFFDVVVSGFAIHHQPDERKRHLYSEIYELLAEPGTFLNLEHVSSSTPLVSELFDSYFIEHLVRFHADLEPSKTREEIEQAYYRRPDKEENILAPVEKQCEWLRRIGFRDVDCFFKIFELALFGGRKIPRARNEKNEDSGYSAVNL